MTRPGAAVRVVSTTSRAIQAGAALDVGAGGALPDGVEDAHRSGEVGAGGVAVVGGEAAGDAGGFGDQFQRRIGVLAHGPGEEGGAVERASAGAERFGGGELHALEQVAIGHALDARQCLLREAGGFRGAVALQEPFDAGEEMPQPVV